MEKLINDFSVGLFFWQSILFLVLIFVLRKLAWKPMLGAVNERESSIKEALASAEKAREEMENLNAENERIMNEARVERDAMLKEAREIKERMITDAKDLAREEGDKMITQAKAQIENEKMAAIEELKNQVGMLSLEIAEKVIEGELKEGGKQKELVGSLLAEVKLN